MVGGRGEEGRAFRSEFKNLRQSTPHQFLPPQTVPTPKALRVSIFHFIMSIPMLFAIGSELNVSLYCQTLRQYCAACSYRSASPIHAQRTRDESHHLGLPDGVQYVWAALQDNYIEANLYLSFSPPHSCTLSCLTWNTSDPRVFAIDHTVLEHTSVIFSIFIASVNQVLRIKPVGYPCRVTDFVGSGLGWPP